MTLLNDTSNMSVVATTYSNEEAEVIKGLLNSFSIECYLSKSTFANLIPGNPQNIQPIEILVESQFENEALNFLNAEFNKNDIE